MPAVGYGGLPPRLGVLAKLPETGPSNAPTIAWRVACLIASAERCLLMILSNVYGPDAREHLALPGVRQWTAACPLTPLRCK